MVWPGTVRCGVVGQGAERYEMARRGSAGLGMVGLGLASSGMVR
jgi:hypothetical protein